MVQINLPENSQVKKGKYFKDKTGSLNLRKVNVYKYIAVPSDIGYISKYTFQKMF